MLDRTLHWRALFKMGCSAARILEEQFPPGSDMKLAGFLLLLSGWVVVIAAVVLLSSGARAVFALAGTSVEALGMGLVFHSHLVDRGQ